MVSVHMAPEHKPDMDATAAAAEKLSPALERAEAEVEAELRARPMPVLLPNEWAAFDKFCRRGYSPRGRVAWSLEAAGLIAKGTWGWTRTRFASEVHRRRLNGVRE